MSTHTEYLMLEIQELTRERDLYRDRLQFDPGGSDKIDELEQALVFTKHAMELAKEKLKETRRALDHTYEALRACRWCASGHSGDEESGEHDEDCCMCLIEDAIAHAEEVFSKNE